MSDNTMKLTESEIDVINKIRAGDIPVFNGPTKAEFTHVAEMRVSLYSVHEIFEMLQRQCKTIFDGRFFFIDTYDKTDGGNQFCDRNSLDSAIKELLKRIQDDISEIHSNATTLDFGYCGTIQKGNYVFGRNIGKANEEWYYKVDENIEILVFTGDAYKKGMIRKPFFLLQSSIP